MRAMTLLAVGLGLAVAAPAGAKMLRTNIVADPAMIDPITYSELVAGDVIGNIYEGFVGLDKDAKVVPALATKWEALPGNLGFRFTLREGVKFHSGRTLGAKDVKWSFEQIMKPGAKGGLTTGYLKVLAGLKEYQDGTAKEISGLVVVAPNVIEVRFTAPDVLFPIYPFHIMDSGIVEEHGATWWTKASAGTGPHRFQSWNRGQSVQLVAHKDYWGGAPKIDGVSFMIVPDDNTAVSQFEAGELDLVYLGGAVARRVLREAKFKDNLMTVPAAQVQYLGMNQNLYEPFRNIKVREAVCIAIDRDGMVRGLFGGAAFPLYGQVTPGVAGYNPAVPKIVHDPARARQLLAEAGYPDGKGLPPVKISSTEPNKAELAYYADQLKKVLGMQVEVDVVERATFIKAMNAGEVAFFPWGWSAGYPDAMYFLSQMWHSASPYNRPRWKNAEFDRLIDQARGIADNEARYKLYNQAEEVLLKDWGTCGTTVRMQIALKQKSVEGVVLTPFRFNAFAGVVVK
ncbi:MAG: ABC transporter substrate-binding protein [Thalassobaculales bacterium]